MSHPLADNMYDHDQIQGQAHNRQIQDEINLKQPNPTAPRDTLDDSFAVLTQYKGLYSINRLGVLKSVPRKGSNGLKKPILGNRGYYWFALSVDSKPMHVSMHRLLAETFIPNPDNKPYVNHIDGNKQNNSLDNLEWVTHQENITHAWKTGLMWKIGKYVPKTKQLRKAK